LVVGTQTEPDYGKLRIARVLLTIRRKLHNHIDRAEQSMNEQMKIGRLEKAQQRIATLSGTAGRCLAFKLSTVDSFFPFYKYCGLPLE
jgi:hypothetical protein